MLHQPISEFYFLLTKLNKFVRNSFIKIFTKHRISNVHIIQHRSMTDASSGVRLPPPPTVTDTLQPSRDTGPPRDSLTPTPPPRPRRTHHRHTRRSPPIVTTSSKIGRTMEPIYKQAARRRPGRRVNDPGYMSRKIRKFRADKFDTRNKRKF